MQSFIFVSTQGDDNNNGSAEAPLQSLEGAAELVRTLNEKAPRNITVLFDEGEYPIDKTIQMDENGGGQKGYSVCYQSLNPQKRAVISGGIAVTGWEEAYGGIYRAKVDEEVTDIRQLYINGHPAQRAKSDKLYRAAARWYNSENREDGFLVTNRYFPKLQKPEDAEIVYDILWTLQRLPVEDIVYNEDSTATVKMQQPYYQAALTMICEGGVQPHAGQSFYIENDPALLDEPGEFYFDKEEKTIYYMPFEEENLQTAETVIGKTEKLISAKGSSAESKIENLSFENIDFRCGAYYSEVNTEGAVAFQAECLVNGKSGANQNPVIPGVGKSLAAQIEFENADHISFTDCDISLMGSTALRLGSGVSNSSVSGCLLSDNGGSAISVGTWECDNNTPSRDIADNIHIQNNVIARPGLDFMSCPAISVYYARGVAIENNSIYDTPYSSISLGWGWGRPSENGVETGPSTAELLDCCGHKVINNRISSISKAVKDGGHIYMLGFLGGKKYDGLKDYTTEDCAYTEVIGNYLSDSADYGGIYFDTGSSGVEVRDNVVETTTNWVCFGETSRNVHLSVNYSDRENTLFKGTVDNGCTSTPVTVCANSKWTPAAQSVVNACGAEKAEEYSSKIEEPDWRNALCFRIPSEEAMGSDEIYVHAGSYTDGKKKDGSSIATYNQGGLIVVGDFYKGDWLSYDVTRTAAQAGEYVVELDYTTGPSLTGEGNPVIRFSVNGEVINDVTLERTGTEWSAYLPCKLGTVTLNEGENTLRIENTVWAGCALRGFKLSPVG